MPWAREQPASPLTQTLWTVRPAAGRTRYPDVPSGSTSPSVFHITFHSDPHGLRTRSSFFAGLQGLPLPSETVAGAETVAVLTAHLLSPQAVPSQLVAPPSLSLFRPNTQTSTVVPLFLSLFRNDMLSPAGFTSAWLDLG